MSIIVISWLKLKSMLNGWVKSFSVGLMKEKQALLYARIHQSNIT